MKQKMIAALTVLLLAGLGGCRGSQDSTTAREDTTQAVTPIGFTARYARTDGYHEDVQYPVVTVITTKNQLDEYYVANKERYFLQRRTPLASNTAQGFLDITDDYDDAFFESHTLVLILTQEGSGSVRHEVTKVMQSSEAVQITVLRDIPNTGTADMAQWHIFAELDNSQYKGAVIRVVFEKGTFGSPTEG